MGEEEASICAEILFKGEALFQLLSLDIPDLSYERMPTSTDGGRLVEKLVTDYLFGEKKMMSNGAKAAILEILGLMLTKYPSRFEPDSDPSPPANFTKQWLLSQSCLVLQSKSSESGLSVKKAGALSAISAALELYGGSQHAEAVRVEHANSDVRTAAASALLGVLRTVTWRVCQLPPVPPDAPDLGEESEGQGEGGGSAPPSPHRLLSQLLRTMAVEVQDPRVRGRKLVLYLKACECLAPATRHIQGQQGISAQLRILQQRLQRDSSTVSMDELGEGPYETQGISAQLRMLQQRLQRDSSTVSMDELGEGPYETQVALMCALSALVRQLTSISAQDLSLCMYSAEGLVASYPSLYEKQRSSAHQALLGLALRLVGKPTSFRVVVQGLSSMLLALTLNPPAQSAPYPSPVTDPNSSQQPYLPLWQALLQAQEVPEAMLADAVDQGEIDRLSEGLAQFRYLLYGDLLRCVLDAFQNLDLGLAAGSRRGRQAGSGFGGIGAASQGEATATSTTVALMAMNQHSQWARGSGGGLGSIGLDESDVGDGAVGEEEEPSLLMSRNQEDMKFCCSIIPTIDISLFRPWAPSFCTELIAAARDRGRLLPGFYRVAAAALEMAAKAGILSPPQPQAGQVHMDGPRDINEMAALSSCATSFQEFLGEAVAPLQLGLQLGVVSPAAVAPLQLGLQLGVVSPAVAVVVMDALERWEQQLPDSLAAMLSDIVPLMGPYLVDLSLLAMPGGQLDQLQQQQQQQQHLPWDVEKRVVLDLPIVDLSTTSPLSLDVLLPRAAQLATSSADRAVRVAAYEPSVVESELVASKAARLYVLNCIPRPSPLIPPSVPSGWVDQNKGKALVVEQQSGSGSGGGSVTEEDVRPTELQSIMMHLFPVLLQLGAKNVRSTELQSIMAHLFPVLLQLGAKNVRPTELQSIMTHLFPVLLQLGASDEPVARQLFQPLARQMREAPTTMALLDSIMDALVSPTHGALRELSAQLTAEFLDWSARTLPPGGPGSRAGFNVQSLLRRLLDRLAHPQPFHRMGAALALQHLAPKLGNHPQLATHHGLELMHDLLRALKLADTDVAGMGTGCRIAAAVDSVFHHVVAKWIGELFVPDAARAAAAFDSVYHHVVAKWIGELFVPDAARAGGE
eukprot:gene11145-18765_t